MATTKPSELGEQLLENPNLAGALESDQFKQFLDHLPIAIAVAELTPAERIVYANIEFERLTGQLAAALEGKPWAALPGRAAAADDGRHLSEAISDEQEYIGAFLIDHDTAAVTVDAWSNVINGDTGRPVFRLVALTETGEREVVEQSELRDRIREKDVQLRELQHRVTNNLQMITSLIRLEARSAEGSGSGRGFDRLAGRIEALGLLYGSLAGNSDGTSVDLGVYLSQIASAVMRAHAVEGIHLNLQVDTWPVSINVAMPAGLVVNELLTNALKHAFAGRDGGTITLHSLVDADGCRVTVADDGIGLAKGTVWPRAGKLSAMIVQSLRQNAKARIEVRSAPGEGMRVTIFFDRADAAPPDPA